MTTALQPSFSRTRGLVELFLSAVLFGVAAFVAKRATREIDGTQVAFVRLCIGLAVAFGQAALRGTPMRPRRWGVLLLRGLFGAVAVLLYFLALMKLPVGTATLLNCTSPVFTAIFAVLFLRERLPWSRAAALCVAAGGIALLVYGQGKALGGEYLWQAVALLSGVVAGAAVTSIRAARRSDGPWEIFAVFCGVGVILIGPLAGVRWTAPSAGGWGLLLAVGLISATAQILMTHALGVVDAASAVTISQITVVTSVGLGTFVDDDPLTSLSIVGGVLTLAGVVWVSRMNARAS